MNVDLLMHPVNEAAPCGPDLSLSSEFDMIAELRREDDATLDQGEWIIALKCADWPEVEARCRGLLSRRSKDLRLAMWLSEAALCNHGYTGLHEGILVCAALCERYWDQMHPVPEGGDMEERVGNIGWLLTRIVRLARTPAVTRGKSGAYSLGDAALARSAQAGNARASDPLVQSEALTIDRFNRALKETPKSMLLEALQGLQGCRTALDAWQACLDARLGASGPSFVAAREALAGAHHDLQRLAREAGALGEEVPDGRSSMQEGVSSDQQEVPQISPPRTGALQSRAQALVQLREVASYFRGTEPHSPVAYLADKAVRWAEMPLHEWLRAVIKDAGPLAHLEEVLGVTPQDAPDGAAR